MTDTDYTAIKVMADYHCFPLWDESPGRVGDIDPRSLPLSDELVERLDAWARRYDAILNMDDPSSSGFASEDEHRDFVREGYTLAQWLKRELGPECIVFHFDHITGETIDIRDT